MNVLIREATEKDVILVKKYTVETAWESFSDSQKRELKREEWKEHLLSGFEKLSRAKNSSIFVAEDEEQAFLGYLWVGEGTNMMTGKNHGFIYDIFVKGEHRGRGIGRLLLQKAEEYCRDKDYPRILLMVSVNNQPAMKLYEKNGFKTVEMYMEKELE
jgi:ribosomal protein S18 acetylase RimI-like enzyme